VLEGGGSFLTILTGEDAPAVDGYVAAVEARHPGLEVEIHEGGQPHYPLLVVAQ
jgi:dihydroxyacetone kinase-like predicted kinase